MSIHTPAHPIPAAEQLFAAIRDALSRRWDEVREWRLPA